MKDHVRESNVAFLELSPSQVQLELVTALHLIQVIDLLIFYR